MHVTHPRFKETVLEPTNREKAISEKAKTRSRNLVYLCWCLVWLAVEFINIALSTSTNLDLIELNKLLESHTTSLSNDDSVVKKSMINSDSTSFLSNYLN